MHEAYFATYCTYSQSGRFCVAFSSRMKEGKFYFEDDLLDDLSANQVIPYESDYASFCGIVLEILQIEKKRGFVFMRANGDVSIYIYPMNPSSSLRNCRKER